MNRSSSKSTIFIIDDHPMFRRGVAESINAEPDLAVCGESAGEPGVIEALVRAEPGLVLLDITLRGHSGLDLLKEILRARPGTRVLMVSMHDEALYAERALRAGARGYIMKHEEPGQLLQCIRQILSGQVYLSQHASSALLENLAGRPARGSRFAVDQLSEREFEVFERLAEGKTTSEIAAQLGLNVRTVVVHCSNIRRKLNIKHGSELVAYAVQWRQSGGSPA